MKKLLLPLLLLLSSIMLLAQSESTSRTDGAITPELLQKLQQATPKAPAERALYNSIAQNGMVLANAELMTPPDDHFTYRVPTKGISDQKKSGRCWLFTGFNVLRAQFIKDNNLGEFYFSHCYSFFWDQLEKANLFLEGILETRTLPITDRKVEWLFQHPINDGGQFTGISDNLLKYGVVPSDVMPETYSSNNTARLSSLIAKLLRQGGMELRSKAEQGATLAELRKNKETTLQAIYRLLCLNLGTPPTTFEYTLRDADGKVLSTKEYTPLSFYQEHVGVNLKDDYVMIMNDPSQPYYETYAIEYDRHAWDGKDWTYLNLPMEEIKEMAIASLKDGNMMYYSCDVGKELNKESGLLTLGYDDYEAITGVPMTMTKGERIASFDSGSTHAMTLVAVDLDKSGKPTKWMVENSWGATAGHQGYLIMTDEWFDAYTFRLVVHKKYLTPRAKELQGKTPKLLPPWSPMFRTEE
ncbi:peptidase C1-like family [Porphyromonas asaccharolytica PR426713P-I]|uniref:aminopeptidase C n=1 Tax=Porphyromonas asaccharolytica TaxID=28123 RepID=UPI0001EB22C0|nr:C1 family peptidase [Porphyromonas asaccharolytica]EFR34596.1 peptidase C1-like family [Porphyromonas asaccharolytica PR426713P-I]